MYKRYELHNHTTESDASITCRDLIELMVKDQADVFAITDHNTISGHRIIRRLLEEENYPIRCIYGMEYTTYYGHILCLNLETYVPWDSINRHRPELLFEAARNAGALTGIAHPFSYGYPFARGCRFDMTVNDFSSVDFIEIFNNPEPLHEVNEKGLLWWEQLTLEGKQLAVTCGMDLHGAWDMAMHFATYAKGVPNGDPRTELAEAIRSRQTWISKGALLSYEYRAENDRWYFRIEDMKKPGYSFRLEDPYLLTLTSADGIRSFAVKEGVLTLSGQELGNAPILIPKLYLGEPVIENLVCVSPVISRPALSTPSGDKTAASSPLLS